MFIEDKLEEINILKLKLPLISRGSTEPISKEDIYKEDQKEENKEGLFEEGFMQGNIMVNKKDKIGFEPMFQQIFD